jgi:hypothetical protein
MNSNEDIHKIEDISLLTEMYIKEAKEANELSKKLELISDRFKLIRDKITSLKHLYDNKSEEKEDVVENENIEKDKKKTTKKTTKKTVQEEKPVEHPVEKVEEKLEEIEKEEEPKNKKVPKSKKSTVETPVISEPVSTKKTQKKKKKDDDE